MARITLALVISLALVACGSSKKKEATLPGTPLYRGSEWAVTMQGGKATAYRLVDGSWQADMTGAVKLTILGPKPGSTQPATPQVAAEMSAKSDLVESALWVDGVELLEKGGGLTPTRGTLYGAPASPLAKGTHTAVAYARTATHGAAVAWTFHV
ncbi:MAG TPA: hypothetical protein VI408_16810 [Gaiellaceae bacterium]